MDNTLRNATQGTRFRKKNHLLAQQTLPLTKIFEKTKQNLSPSMFYRIV